jgi:hypothetical protein
VLWNSTFEIMSAPTKIGGNAAFFLCIKLTRYCKTVPCIVSHVN